MSRVAGRSTRREGNGAADRIKAMVDEKLDAGLEYEALQLYKGQAARKAAKRDFDAAAAMAEAGATTLMQRGFADSAAELCNQLIEIYSENGQDITDERMDRIKRLNELFTALREGELEVQGKGSEAGKASAGKLQAKFLKAAIAWTAAKGTRQHGDAELNALLGRCLFSQRNYDAGMARLVIGEQPAELVEQLMRADLTQPEDPEKKGEAGASAKQKGSKKKLSASAEDLHRERLLTLSVLHFLALGNLRDANVMREAWTAAAAAAAAADSEGTVTPVGGSPDGMQKFCRMLCRTCEYDAAPLFQRLVETVSRGNGTDPALERLLAQVGRVFFGIQPPPSMMESMMKMLGIG